VTTALIFVHIHWKHCRKWCIYVLHHIRGCHTFENRSFEWLLKPVIVYRQLILRDSHCYFSAMRLKSGGYGTPHSKKWGIPPYPPKVTPMHVSIWNSSDQIELKETVNLRKAAIINFVKSYFMVELLQLEVFQYDSLILVNVVHL